jgi:hypothetical protein
MSQLSTVSGNDRVASISEPPSAFNSPTSHRDTLPLSGEIVLAEDTHPELDVNHGLAVPAPVSKGQPSWDGFNATPIAEEEAFHYEKRPDLATEVVDQPQDINTETNLAPASGLTPSKSERSNSDDTRFYSMPDGSPEESEWVMVSPQLDLHVASADAVPTSSQIAPALPEPKLDDVSATEVPASTMHSNARFESESDITEKPTPPAGVVAFPTSSQEALEGVEPALHQPHTSTTSGIDSFTDTHDIPIPPKHALHHKRASIDLVKRASLDLAGTPQQTLAPTHAGAEPYEATQRTVNDEREVSPERHENPTTTSWLSSGTKSHSRNVSSISVLDRPRGAPVEESTTPVSAAAVSPINANFPLTHSIQQPTQTVSESQIPADPQQQQNKSTFLPPIRRTSTFGIGFGPRQKQTRFPIEDDEDVPRPTSQDWNDSTCQVNHEHGDDCLVIKDAQVAYENKRVSQTSLEQDSTLEHASIVQSSPVRPKMVRVSSSEQSQRAIATKQSDPNLFTPTLNGQPGSSNNRQSQDSWRPNVASPLAEVSHNPRTDGPGPQSRTSWEPQRARGSSGSAAQAAYGERAPWVSAQSKAFEQPPSSAQRYPELFQAGIDRDGGDLPAYYYQQPIAREEAFLPRQQTSEYEIPGVGPPADMPRSNSSRRGSKEFFRELGGRLSRGTSRERNGSRSRDGAVTTPPRPFGSRGNDNSASSVASEEGREQQKRRSSFFGTMNRASTVGLGPPQSRESVVAHHSGSRTDLLASGRQSPAPDPKKRFLFGNSSTAAKVKSNRLGKAATSGNLEDSGKKKRFSGLTGLFGKSEGGSRTSIPAPTRLDTTKNLSNHERQPLSSTLSNPNIQPGYSSPSQAVYTPPTNSHQEFTTGSSSWPNKLTTNGGRSSSRSRMLSKFTASSSPQHETPPKSTVLETKNKNRRPSAAGLFGGFMGRKHSSQQEREKSDESRSQASTSHTPQPLPQAQTYTDLQQEQQQQQLYDQPYRQNSDVSRAQTFQNPHDSRRGPPGGPEQRFERGSQRGRQTVREPEYDNVPIPGGYNLVRGQGAMASPTQYDPRGINQYQQDSNQGQTPMSTQQHSSQSYMYQTQTRGQSQYDSTSPSGHDSLRGRSIPATSQAPKYSADRTGDQFQIHNTHHLDQASAPSPVTRNKPPSFGALETFEAHQARSANRRISSEDVLARSPARLPEGQQRPYKLSLPGDNEEDERPMPVKKDSPVVVTNSRFSATLISGKPKHESVQRLQNPTINHPGSPASYALPDASYSPINPAAKDLPPPPTMPPNWESQSSHLDPQYTSPNSPLLNQNGFGGVDRSNTHRTAVSAISQVSHLSNNENSPVVDPGASAHDKESGIYQNSRSRSPSITPERMVSPEPNPDRGRRDDRGTSREAIPSSQIKNSQVVRGPSPDLYDASPRLPITQTLTAPSPKPSPKPSPIQTTFTTSKPVAPIRMVTPEPNTLAPGSHGVRRSITPASEEKIFVGHGGGSGGIVHEMDADPTPSMSATSYPGQEWNPYSGGWDDGLD